MDTLIQTGDNWQPTSDRIAVDFLEIIQITTRRCRVMNAETRLKFYRQ